jgi:3-hydroxybutyryl-CoA dehydrogenase
MARLDGDAHDQQAERGRAIAAAEIVGVLGAGTMGSGIAQLALRAGAHALLYDPLPNALSTGIERIAQGLQKEAARGGAGADAHAQVQAALDRVQTVNDLAALAHCDLVIEAAPERLDLKHELFKRVASIVGDQCVLATNTSSLPVTAIAAAASLPERVVGMHFFNPAPVMRLLEVVSGEQSSEHALALAHATGEATGPDFSSTAATVRSASRRFAYCRRASRTCPRSTECAAWRAAFAWGRSS